MRIEEVGGVTIIQGDAVESLRLLDDKSVNCCVTSPPYFGLRDYGHDGQIGLEPTVAEYVASLVAVFSEVHRVLRDDGVLFLNLGDSYAAKRSYQVPSTKGGPKHSDSQSVNGRGSEIPAGLKPKDLIGIPWRVAFALQEAGWYLRQDIIWHKPNPMPESVTDRCTKAHEYLFLLSKSERYYWNREAMQEPATGAPPGNQSHKHTTEYEDSGDEKHRTKAGLVDYAKRQRSKRDSFKRENSKRGEAIPGQAVGTHRPDRDESEYPLETRNKRSVWTVATSPYKGAHFAVFPPKLIEPCVLAGCPPGGLVLDPFGGSGTTGMVAQQHGRNAVLIELNPTYIDLCISRVKAATLPE